MSGNLKLNSLVPPTWNRLKVNEYEISLPGDLAIGSAAGAFEAAGAKAVTASKGFNDASEFPTGCGRELSEYLESKGASPEAIEINDSKPLLTKIDIKEDSADIIRITAREGQVLNILTDITLASDKKITGIFQLQILAEKNAWVNLTQIIRPGNESTFVNDIGVRLLEGAEINLIQIYAGGAETVSGYRAELSGEKSISNVYAGLTMSNRQKLDMNFVLRHTGRQTFSETNVSGALSLEAEKTFRGTIDFVKGCAGSEGAENESMLLLDDTVVNKTVPLILCDEEAVAGSHGASIGRPADEMLYYMMSRGITKENALKILEKASLDSAASHIEDEQIKEYAGGVIDSIFNRSTE